MQIPFSNNERKFALSFYLFGFVHPLGTAAVLVYFLGKVIVKCYSFGISINRHVSLKLNYSLYYKIFDLF